jgi:hypothetical protein
VESPLRCAAEAGGAKAVKSPVDAREKEQGNGNKK